jgi:[protein-PII] uridylyltransferase
MAEPRRTSAPRARARAVASPRARAPNAAGLRVDLGDKIAALAAGSKPGDKPRGAVVELLRATLAEGHAKARAYLDAGGKGMVCARYLSYLEDEIIGAIYDYVVRFVYVADNPTFGERLTIIAVGGYGRGTLAPGSDIDLLFLLPYKQTPWGESVVEAILYLLWDLRQKVGHSSRSVAECLRQARADITIRTTILEARFILGNTDLYRELITSFDREIVRTDAREFVAAKLAERDQRVTRAGSSRYLVEPNVKESKGGLRDMHTLFWIAKYVYRVRAPEELVAAGLFSAAELALFRRCEEFLWRVRCQLHFSTGRAEERLSFDLQPVLAAKFGYHDRAGLSHTERFMKHYFLVAKDVGDLTAIVCAALEERQAKPRAMLDRVLGRLRRRARKLPSPNFTIDHDRVNVVDEGVFARDPVDIIRLFWTADRYGLAIHPDAVRAVTRSLRLIDGDLRADKEANRLFLEILLSHATTETVLRRMNETGVLGRFIPEFGRIVAMMQFNMYHHYTVDEHLLRAVGALAELESGRGPKQAALAADILPTIANRKSLYLGLLLHDIAKGRKEDHSQAGAQTAHSLCPRLGFDQAETETVAWLVQHHLLMSSIAQSRDLSDRRTIENFAAIVQTMERLKMLLVLTMCDIHAVGPGVLDAWKAQLLNVLYWETEVVLGGGHSAADRKSRVAHAKEELRTALSAWSDAEFEQYAQRHYSAYWLKADLERKVRHAHLLRELNSASTPLATTIDLDTKSGAVELTVIAQDHRRLLSIIAGACAASGANIVDAHIFTTTDGLALDTIFFSRAFPLDEDEMRRARRVADYIEKALRGEIVISEAVAARSANSRPSIEAFDVVADVVIDNSFSNMATVIEVSGLDRVGLLFDLTNAISNLNINIGSAHIVTFGERAVDTFYVSDLTGGKIISPARQTTIKRQLLEVFAPEREKRVARA